MQLPSIGYIAISILFLLVNHFAHSLSVSQLYPFGAQDETLKSREQDVSSSEIPLSVPIVFFHETFGSIFVNDNGLLSFMTEVRSFYNQEFPLFYPIIAPMYSDVDMRGHGTVYYRETKEQELLDRATNDIFRYFSDGRTFRAQSLFIVTWHEVTPNQKEIEMRNTVQLAIASNGTESYCFFFYPENGIQWVRGSNDIYSMPNAFTQAGFMSSDGRFFKLKGSGTEQVKNYPRMSNVKQNGVFAFHCGNTGNGNIIEPDQDYQESLQTRGTETCANTNNPCLTTATCQDYQTGICCKCEHGFYGNGRSCLKSDEAIRVNGKLNGVVNEQKLEDVILYTYVELRDGRIYTSLNNIDLTLGYDVQTSLMALSSIVGWLFAQPVDQSTPNGFTLTGGVFNRSVNIMFPQTGHSAVIVEEFQGLDIFNFMNYKSQMHGSLPTIPSDSNVNIDDFKQEFTRVSAGTLKSRLTHSFSFGENSMNMPIIIDQTIQFEECQHRPVDYQNTTTRLVVTQNHITYDTDTKIARYASNLKITPLSENNPCQDVQCGPESTCIVEGSSYRCICNRGFEQIYNLNNVSGPQCIDIDECRTRGHSCSPFAECINVPGSYHCRCAHGFVGNGYECSSTENECNNIQCHTDADCIQTKNMGPRCMCKNGYYGDGYHCSAIQDDQDDCRTLSLCDMNAECKLNRLIGKYTCVCKASFRGDGIVCTEESESCEKMNNCGTNAECISDESSNHAYYCSCNTGFVGDGYTCIAEINADDCNILNNCHRHGECVPSRLYPNEFECRCNPGFFGDGYRCHNASNINKCNGPESCSPNGECVYDDYARENICRCRAGFAGNGIQCNPTNECDQNENRCGANAACQFNPQNMKYECQCIPGYIGDGLQCLLDDSAGCSVQSDCHQNAACVVDPLTLNYHCQCNSGFEGNGKICRQFQSCNVINNCDVKAECIFDQTIQNYACSCREGFMGDGYHCRPRMSCNEHRSVCDRNADCQYNHVYKDYRCSCHHGFIGDGYSCAPIPVHDGDFLVFTQGMSIIRMPLPNAADTTTGYPLIMKSGHNIISAEVDCLNGHIYWSDLNQGNIHRAPYNGTTSESILQLLLNEGSSDATGTPEGIALDWVSRNIYWTDSRKKVIEVANLDGSLQKVLISDNLFNPRGIAVHPGSGKLYWTDWNRVKPTIESANLDGTMRTTLVEKDLKLPNHIVIDYEHNDLCWTDAGLHRIECINLYNTASRRVIYAQASYPFDLTIAQNNIFWTDWDTKSIHQVDRNGGVAQQLEIPRGGHGRLFGIATVPRNCPRITNACSVDNGGCKYLCLPNDHGRSCVCPDNSYDEHDHCNGIQD